MDALHNPDRYIADLRQILSQGRKKLGILVGAGAPLAIKVNEDGHLDPAGSPLIPGVDRLTARAVEGLNEAESGAVKQVQLGLMNGGNIESILSRVRLLQNAIGTTPVHGLNSEQYKKLGQKICQNIGSLVGVRLPQERTPYDELIAWISGTQRPHAVEVFTTNYDLLLESALEKAKAPYFDGFTGGHAPFFDPVSVAGNDLPSRWTRLWKLHGSLGWKVDDGVVIRTGGFDCNELIYPDHLKYDLTQKQPYSALFERLKHFLQAPDSILLTIGFSFRDSHINAVIDEALAINANSSVFAFQFQKMELEEPACKLALERPNLSVYAADGAVIGGVAGQWEPGDPPTNWREIRKSFWAVRENEDASSFLLGDFAAFSRFCALSYSTEFSDLKAEEEVVVHAGDEPENDVTIF